MERAPAVATVPGGRMEVRAAARRASSYVTPYKFRVVAALVCVGLQTALALAPFLIIKALVDDLRRPNGSFSTIARLGAAGLGLALAAGLVDLLRGWIVLRITTSVVADLRRQLVSHLLDQSVAFFTDTKAGDLMSRILNDVSTVQAVIGDTVLSLISNVLIAGFCLVAMVFVEPRLTLVTVLIVPPVVYAVRRVGRPVYRTRQQVQERIADFTAHTQEVLSVSGIMLVKSFARTGTERDRSARLTEELRQSEVRAAMTSRWTWLVFQLVQFLAPLALLLTGAWLIEHHYASLGTVVAFVTVLVLRFGASLSSIGNGIVKVISALPAWTRIFEVLDDDVEITEKPDAVALHDVRGAVRFDGVVYAYPGQGRPAINGVSLAVEPGQLVALVGPSGAGKTTLTSLVARFYDPQQGSVQIDGHDLRDVTLHSLAQSIGLVLQETYLFHGTLRENLLYARPEATDDELAEACRLAYLDHVIANLSDGLDTVVGERGHRLSGGEKQRVALARVILKDAPIVVLDEATSHLDSTSERFVQAAMAQVFSGRTSFVIAHRLSTVLAADMVVVLSHGEIVQTGTHAELLAESGLYSELYELQFRPHSTDVLAPLGDPQ